MQTYYYYYVGSDVLHSLKTWPFPILWEVLDNMKKGECDIDSEFKACKSLIPNSQVTISTLTKSEVAISIALNSKVFVLWATVVAA